MDIEKMLAELAAEGAALAKKASETPDSFTEEDVARAEHVVAEHARLKALADRQDAVSKSLAAVTAKVEVVEPEPIGEESTAGLSLGEQFVKSREMREFRKAHPHGLSSGTPVHVAVKTGQRDIRKAAVLGTGSAGLDKRPEWTDNLVYRPERTLLDLIFTGTTDEGYLPYRQLTAFTNEAAIVAEAKDTEGAGVAGGVKPVSALTFTPAEAKAATYADGVEVTNQELSDDGAIQAIIDSMLTDNLRARIEDKLLNGTGVGDEPKGLLKTTGVQQQAWDTDILTTLRKAKTKLTSIGTRIQAVLVHPEDEETVDLLKDQQGRFLGAGPFASQDSTVWAVPRVESQAIEKGQALMGDFSTIHFLVREAIKIEAFNQHKDYASRNIQYLRAEARGMQIFRAPGRFALVDLTA